MMTLATLPGQERQGVWRMWGQLFEMVTVRHLLDLSESLLRGLMPSVDGLPHPPELSEK